MSKYICNSCLPRNMSFWNLITIFVDPAKIIMIIINIISISVILHQLNNRVIKNLWSLCKASFSRSDIILLINVLDERCIENKMPMIFFAYQNLVHGKFDPVDFFMSQRQPHQVQIMIIIPFPILSGIRGPVYETKKII